MFDFLKKFKEIKYENDGRIKVNIVEFKNALLDYQFKLSENLKTKYEDIEIKTLELECTDDWRHSYLYLYIKVICLYNYSVQPSVISTYLIDAINKFNKQYIVIDDDKKYTIHINEQNVTRIYDIDEILEVGKQYIKCSNNCEYLPYNITTMKYMMVKINGIDYPISKLVKDELDKIKCIKNPNRGK